MKLRQLSVAVPLASDEPSAEAVIEIFHRWIQSGAPGLETDRPTGDHLLIDVVDYRHVPSGPGVLLIAHEGFYGLSATGLRFSARRDEPGEAGDKIAEATDRLLAVAAALEAEEAIEVRFDRRHLSIAVGDRLIAPSAEILADTAAKTLAKHLGCDVSGRPDIADVRGLPAAALQIS